MRDNIITYIENIITRPPQPYQYPNSETVDAVTAYVERIARVLGLPADKVLTAIVLTNTFTKARLSIQATPTVEPTIQQYIEQLTGYVDTLGANYTPREEAAESDSQPATPTQPPVSEHQDEPQQSVQSSEDQTDGTAPVSQGNNSNELSDLSTSVS